MAVNDGEHMRRALSLAKRGLGLTSPNPPVGAVLVKDGAEVGSGWHKGSGQPHAEVEAIRDAVRRHGDEVTQGATIYVTLEPCSTHGRTGSCTAALIRAGFSRVVVGARDPNPSHEGRAGPLLLESGIDYAEGIEESGCEAVIRAFAKVQRSGLPWVIIKSAFGLDGKVTRPQSEGQWLSGQGSRAEVHGLRGEVDAILTTGKTVRCDNPRLTIRGEAQPVEKRQPLRVVLTSRDQGVPRDSQVLTDDFRDKTLIYSSKRIECVLRDLVSDHGVLSIMVEAGGNLVGQLLDEGWADEVVFYLAPLITGGSVPAAGGEGVADLRGRIKLQSSSFRRIGDDVRVRAMICRGEGSAGS
ncbi:MAG TPA: bifunctional diaminohydroxyphosphoribosylaminopyrimidine deaminase/5-amino-6-(5-phosphoribosylamino)uracil reductase RibD [Verrucomicrobiales bacterium]|nr:bifunctional diaminohydroxyphosphoribosylaminopyrimidine deaminase/5-amino-6-(5-phosphoribosylamino)uracil reductase RibD [Verrucomicrobiales bacterium]